MCCVVCYSYFFHVCAGVPLDKFLADNSEKIDLRGRQLIVQQVLNALANIHTGGSEDRMSFWGSFLGECVLSNSFVSPLSYIVMPSLSKMKCLEGYTPKIPISGFHTLLTAAA